MAAVVDNPLYKNAIVSENFPDKIELSLTYRRHVGCCGTMFIFLALAMAAASFYVVFEYSFGFRNLNRLFVWFIASIGLAFLCVGLYVAVTWKKTAKACIEDSGDKDSQENDAKTCKSKLMKLKKDFVEEDGSHYLFKLHVNVVASISVQTWNMIIIYLCTLPLIITSVLLCTIIAFLVHLIWSLSKPYTVLSRNRITIILTIIDLGFLIIPLAFLWLSYRVPFSVDDLRQLILWPSISLLIGYVDLTQNIVKDNVISDLKRAQRRLSVKLKRRRTSLYQLHDETISIIQIEKFNVKWQSMFAIVYLLWALFLSITCIIQIGTIQEVEEQCKLTSANSLWNSCKVKTPFCQSLFIAKCNCVVLSTDQHNLTTLGSEFTDMSALRYVKWTNGPLTNLPADMGQKLTFLSVLILSNNNLSTLPPDLNYLHTIVVEFNKLKFIPKNFWGNSRLYWIDFNTNKLGSHTFSQVNKFSKNLFLLNLANNTLNEIPKSLNGDNCPILRILSLSGNSLHSLPSGIGSLPIRDLYLARNNFSSIPSEIQKLELRELDLRNNSFKELPNWMSKMSIFSKSTGLVTVANNPLCKNGWIDSKDCPEDMRLVLRKEGYGCATQCSDYCFPAWLQNSGCDVACNSKKCEYDNGQCDANN